MKELFWAAAGGLVVYAFMHARETGVRAAAAATSTADADRATGEPEKGTDAFEHAGMFLKDTWRDVKELGGSLSGGFAGPRPAFEPPVLKSSGGCGCGCS